MGTFGEIVEPGSRTAWEDWDDVDWTSDLSALQWRTPLQVSNIENLYILESKFLSDCVKVQSKDHLILINSIAIVNLHLYQIRSSEQYVCCIGDYNLLQSSEIIELLKPILSKSENVLVVQTKPLMEYQAENLSSELCIIRQLSTSKPCSKLLSFDCGKLEQPNILSGVAAGALCLRDHMNLSAIALIFYVENIEEYRPQQIQKLLQKFHIVENCSTNLGGVLSSNLYI